MPEKLGLILPDMQTDLALTKKPVHSRSDHSIDRRDSNDSGMDIPVFLARRSTGVAIAMKRVSPSILCKKLW